MFSSMGYGVYLFFACMMLISVPFVIFLLPETKNMCVVPPLALFPC